jgi:hypothetical protein
MQDEADRGNVWSIALVGGDGVRTKEFISRWLGAEKPKQYCTLVGSRSMCQHTLDRTARLTPGAHSRGRSQACLLREIIKGGPYQRKDELVQKEIPPRATYEGIKYKIVAKQQ